MNLEYLTQKAEDLKTVGVVILNNMATFERRVAADVKAVEI